MPGTFEIGWGVLKTLGNVILRVAVVIGIGVVALVAQLWRDLTQRLWRPVLVVFGGLALIWVPYLVTHPHMEINLPAHGQAEPQTYDLGARVAFLNPFKPGEPVARQFMEQDRSDFGVKDPLLLAYLQDYQAYYMRFWWGYMAWLGAYGVLLIMGFFQEEGQAEKLRAPSMHTGGYMHHAIDVSPPSPLRAGEGALAAKVETPQPTLRIAPATATAPVARPASVAAPPSRRRRGLRIDGAERGGAEFLARLASGEDVDSESSPAVGVRAPAAAVTSEGAEAGGALDSGGGPPFKSGEAERPTEGLVEPELPSAKEEAPQPSKPVEAPPLTRAEIERLAREAEEKQLIMPDFTAPAFGRNRDYDRGM